MVDYMWVFGEVEKREIKKIRENLAEYDSRIAKQIYMKGYLNGKGLLECIEEGNSDLGKIRFIEGEPISMLVNQISLSKKILQNLKELNMNIEAEGIEKALQNHKDLKHIKKQVDIIPQLTSS